MRGMRRKEERREEKGRGVCDTDGGLMMGVRRGRREERREEVRRKGHGASGIAGSFMTHESR